LYDPRYPETGVAPGGGPDSPSNLPPEHPDFSPKEHCPPRVLFPEARARRKRPAESGDVNEAAVLRTPTEGKGGSKEKQARAQRYHHGKKSEWDTSDEEDGHEAPTTLTVQAPVTPVRARAHAPKSTTVKPPSHRRTASQAVESVIEAPRTRSRTRASSIVALVPPKKDRSDPARRAFGPRVREP
jgi:hypothetical protein